MFHLTESGLISTSSKDLEAFRLVRPMTINEAVSYLSETNNDPVAYAGGVDLFSAFKENKKIGTLVWLKDINEMKDISIKGDVLRIGSLVSFEKAVKNEKLECLPGFKQALEQIANMRIRMQATIGGNIMARRTSYEMLILLYALDAKINFTNKKGDFNLSPAEIWESKKINKALLTFIDIPIGNAPQIDYERSIRPLYTQALATFDNDSKNAAFVVIATEFLRPYRFEIYKNQMDSDQLFDTLPPDYYDLRLSNEYIRSIVPILYKRQLARLERDS